jgi:protein-serine/threonine kinase
MSTLKPRTPKAFHTASYGVLSEDASPGNTSGHPVSVNEENWGSNSHLPSHSSDQNPGPTSTSMSISTTIAPSPPATLSTALAADTPFPHLDTNSRRLPVDTPTTPSPALQIQTDIIPGYTVTSASNNTTARSPSETTRIPQITQSINIPLARTSSIKNVFAGSIGSNSNFGSASNSALSSPMLNAMADVTPLPSPLMSGDSPGPWKRLASRPQSRELMIPTTADSALVTANGESISSAIANQSKRRAYHGLIMNANEPSLSNTQVDKEKAAEGHTKNRSISEYIPELLPATKARHITVSGSHAPIVDAGTELNTSIDTHMRREPHLAVQRGLAPIRPPTPPSSRTGGESSDSDSSLSASQLPRAHKKPRSEFYDAYTREDQKRRRWRALKTLGQGTFSKVMLATSQATLEINRIDEDTAFGHSMEGVVTSNQLDTKIDRKKLVAVKICEHGPKGGASEERVEMSLKRELEIMKTIHHPSLVHLKAWSIEDARAILVLSYCPGGDLFEVASEHPDALVPGLLQRIFSELVAAVQYLHERHIVHRDIKLESKSYSHYTLVVANPLPLQMSS